MAKASGAHQCLAIDKPHYTRENCFMGPIEEPLARFCWCKILAMYRMQKSDFVWFCIVWFRVVSCGLVWFWEGRVGVVKPQCFTTFLKIVVKIVVIKVVKIVDKVVKVVTT